MQADASGCDVLPNLPRKGAVNSRVHTRLFRRWQPHLWWLRQEKMWRAYMKTWVGRMDLVLFIITDHSSVICSIPPVRQGLSSLPTIWGTFRDVFSLSLSYSPNLSACSWQNINIRAELSQLSSLISDHLSRKPWNIDLYIWVEK